MVFNVEFSFDNNPLGIYYAGQQLSGTITVTCDDVKQVQEVYFEIKGFTHVHWTKICTKNVNGKSRIYTKEYNGHQDFLDSKAIVRTPDPEDLTTTILPGTYTYRFTTQIPPCCPSSFEAKQGHNRYFVKLVLVNPDGKKIDQTFTKAFNVIKVMDLNLKVPAKGRGLIASKKTFGFWPFKSEPLQMCVQIPQTGYVPGQTISISVHIDNGSSINIKESIVRLIMNAYFCTTIPLRQKRKSIIVQEIKGPGMDKKTEDSMNLDLPIPPTPPNCTEACYLIQISYQIEIILVTNMLHQNHKKKLDVIIGNVPLKPKSNEHTNDLNKRKTLVPNEEVNAPCLLPPPYPHLAAFIPVDEQDIYPNIPGMPEKSPFENILPEDPLHYLRHLPPPSYETAAHLPEGKENFIDKSEELGENIFKPYYPRFEISNPDDPAI